MEERGEPRSRAPSEEMERLENQAKEEVGDVDESDRGVQKARELNETQKEDREDM